MISNKLMDSFSWKRALLAGIFISFGAIFSLKVSGYGMIARGLCFGLGLYGVLICNAQLFTGSILKIERMWTGHRDILDLLTFWILLWIFNMFGAWVVVLLSQGLDLHVSAMATARQTMPVNQLFIKSIFCNFLVCLSVWIYNHHAKDPVNAFLAVLLPVTCFIVCGFEHSIADMFYMMMGIAEKSSDAWDFFRVVGITTIGNVLGGFIFTFLVSRAKFRIV